MPNHAPYETVISAYKDGGGVPTDATVVASTSGRIRALMMRGGASVADLILKDGGSGGTVIFTAKLGIGTVNSLTIPGAGIPFDTDVFADFGAASQTVTVFYST